MYLPRSTISVVIPAYNCADSILDALASVFSQTRVADEVIVVNDGSTDATLSVLRQSPYANDIVILSGANAGPAEARNKGIRAARGEWIAFLDADDLWTEREKLAAQLALAKAHPTAVLIDSFAHVIWSHGKSSLAKVHKQGEVFEQFLLCNAVNATSSVIARRSAILQAGLFRPEIRFGEDRLLWAALAKIGEVHTLPQVTVRKINHTGNLTSFSERNYDYRLRCIEILLEMGAIEGSQRGRIWFSNQEEFFRAAMYSGNVSQFQHILRQAREQVGWRILLSRYFYLALYARLFNSFRPLVTVSP